MKARITINGQTYSSVEEMPPDVRRQYEFAMGALADEDANGIPDILEGKDVPLNTATAGLLKSGIVSNVTTSRVTVNGQEYSQWEDVPAAIRDVIEKAGVGLHGKPALEMSAPAAAGATSANVPLHAVPAAAGGGMKIGLVWLILLLLVAVLAGMLIGVKFLR